MLTTSRHQFCLCTRNSALVSVGCRYENLSIQRIFSTLKIDNSIEKNNIFNIFAQDIDCWYTLSRTASPSTHNLCFGAKIRKIGIPLHTPVLLYKIGVQKGYTLHGHVFVINGACKL